MKDYEMARQERAVERAARQLADAVTTGNNNNDSNAMIEETSSGSGSVQPMVPLVKFGPKSKQEVRERLGFQDTR